MPNSIKTEEKIWVPCHCGDSECGAKIPRQYMKEFTPAGRYLAATGNGCQIWSEDEIIIQGDGFDIAQVRL